MSAGAPPAMSNSRNTPFNQRAPRMHPLVEETEVATPNSRFVRQTARAHMSGRLPYSSRTMPGRCTDLRNCAHAPAIHSMVVSRAVNLGINTCIRFNIHPHTDRDTNTYTYTHTHTHSSIGACVHIIPDVYACMHAYTQTYS